MWKNCHHNSIKPHLIWQTHPPKQKILCTVCGGYFPENGERDLVVLRHEVAILWPDGKRELRGINLVEYGEIGGHSAMAKAVGFPAAIASKMILDGE
jgi:hypothetical protein